MKERLTWMIPTQALDLEFASFMGGKKEKYLHTPLYREFNCSASVILHDASVATSSVSWELIAADFLQKEFTAQKVFARPEDNVRIF